MLKKTRLICNVVLCAILFMLLTACVSNKQEPTLTGGRNENAGKETEMSYTEYLEDLFSIQLKPLVKQEEGEKLKGYGKGSVFIRLQIADGQAKAVAELINGAAGSVDLEFLELPGYFDHAFAAQLREETIIAAWGKFFGGTNGAKTRSTDLYLTENGEGNCFLYFFG